MFVGAGCRMRRKSTCGGDGGGWFRAWAAPPAGTRTGTGALPARLLRGGRARLLNSFLPLCRESLGGLRRGYFAAAWLQQRFKDVSAFG